MGVPALFRWLSEKYSEIIEEVIEESPTEIDGVKRPVDISKPNPEFDNLYLDMNSIIHPCCHPAENKPAPDTEEDMMIEIMKYTERIVTMIRPRKILYLAIDGVAPCAKMNQQRSRRFKTAKEAKVKEGEAAQEKEKLSGDQELQSKKSFDRNCITPGTPFMARLAVCLRYWIADKLNTGPGWTNLKVILSDANVPGEGEHKIMDFIRAQRASPNHDPNTRHVIYGSDADLIMLSLATHEPHFKVLQEDRRCSICRRSNHTDSKCRDRANQKQEQDDEKGKAMAIKPYIFLNVQVLREYLKSELEVSNIPWSFNLENAIDDWVFLCFFVGNDFLPHLPSLEIRECAINTLVTIWKSCLQSMGGYLTNNGDVDLKRLQYLVTDLGKQEKDIFIQRHENEQRRAEIDNLKRKTDKLDDKNLTSAEEDDDINDDDDDSQSVSKDSNDSIRLWKEGSKERYYKQKFDVDLPDKEFQKDLARSYIEGLSWVLKYYYQGVPSWKWYYPYHYSPFASDFIDIGEIPIKFELGEPLKPFEQLMSVLPAQSKEQLPIPFHKLMTDKDSDIIEFYPEEFEIDLNGKRHAWQGIARLPFIDVSRLLKAAESVYPQLTKDVIMRNTNNYGVLCFSNSHKLYNILSSLYSDQNLDEPISLDDLDPNTSDKLIGLVSRDPNFVPNDTFRSPLIEKMPDIISDKSMSVSYRLPAKTAENTHTVGDKKNENQKIDH